MEVIILFVIFLFFGLVELQFYVKLRFASVSKQVFCLFSPFKNYFTSLYGILFKFVVMASEISISSQLSTIWLSSFLLFSLTPHLNTYCF